MMIRLRILKQHHLVSCREYSLFYSHDISLELLQLYAYHQTSGLVMHVSVVWTNRTHSNATPLKSLLKGEHLQHKSVNVRKAERKGVQLTIAVLVGMYTCTKFLRSFHAKSVVKKRWSSLTLPRPPNSGASVLSTILYVPACSTPTL
jgi:hypothetical protein